MKKVGVFGGSFDPPHNAHLEMAALSTETVPLDRLYFVPSYQAPLKVDPPVAPVHHRVAMVELLAQLHAKWQVLRYEVDQQRPVQTLETIEYLLREQPEDRLYLIIGGDQAAQFHLWHQWRHLLELVQLVCFTREGQSPSVPEMTERMMTIPYQVNCSSTQVRARHRAGESFEDMVPPPVQRYILTHQLYQ